MNHDQNALELHKRFAGKITTELRDKSQLDRDKLSAYYTPGVAAVSQLIAANPEKMAAYTWTNNLVAVISDGSAVLGLGDIGPRGSMPVMEGKALLFKHFANIDAVPIILDVHSEEEIIRTVKAIAPSFGAINLEDIAAPKCFSIEEQLKNDLSIPVFHDDQHGTAIVVLAGLINAFKLTQRSFSSAKIVIAGAGAAGVAIAQLLNYYTKSQGQQPQILAVDSQGIIQQNRQNLNQAKLRLLEFTNSEQVSGSLADAVAGADVFIGVSGPDTLKAADVATMAAQPIVFALSNPTPEIMPDIAKTAGAAVIATGRSDFPNQVNNALAFPGIFRGALDNQVAKITDSHKIAAAEALAGLVDSPSAEEIIPSIFTANLMESIAEVIK